MIGLVQRLRARFGLDSSSDDRRQLDQLRRRLANQPRRTAGRQRIFGWDLEYLDGLSMLSSLEVLVLDGWNDFESTTECPVILDCGANIGISVLNYKRRYPGARITAFEADPDIVPVLRRNLQQNDAADAEIVDAAVWTSDGEARWLCEGTDGSRIITDGTNDTTVASVRTVDLRRYLDRQIDLLKIDIEGGEYELLDHIEPHLDSVDQLVIECHVTSGDVAPFGKVLEILSKARFRVGVNSLGPRRDLVYQPATAEHGFDQYFVVAGWRTRSDSSIRNG